MAARRPRKPNIPSSKCGSVVYQRRRSLGICVHCAWPIESSKGVLCQGCVSNRKANSAARRKWASDNGFCSMCTQRKRTKNRWYCQECAAYKKKAYARKGVAGTCLFCTRQVAAGKKRCQTCIDVRRSYKKEHRARLVAEVLRHYGAYCVCCGETDVACLSIDHVDGGGSKHRKKDRSATDIYWWLRRNGYPPGFQTMCHNCNRSKGVGKFCHHQLQPKQPFTFVA